MPVEEPKETPPSPPPPVVDEAPPPAPPPSLLPTPTITSGRFKADMTKYSFKQAPGKVKGQPKLTKPDLSPRLHYLLRGRLERGRETKSAL